MCGYRRGGFGRTRRPVNFHNYTYVGPCRCGNGPHAFYQDEQGRIIPAHHLYYNYPPYQPTKEDLKAELKAAKQEKEEMEKYIKELEQEINSKQK